MRTSVGTVAGATVVGLLIVAGSVVARPVAAARASSVPVTVAPDEATAARVARAQGSRVEVASLRTETRVVYAEPKGGMTAELHARPVRVRRGGGWVAADSTLVRRPDGTVGPRAATVDLVLSGGGAKGPLVRLGKGAWWLALSWPGSLPEPDLSGSSATYAEVLPGVDLVLRAEVDGYTQHLVVKDAEAARNPALARVRLGLQTGGLTVRAAKAGVLEARDGGGKVVLASPASRMWDSRPVRREAAVKVSIDDRSLTLLPDRALFADPETRFPVTVDPAFRTPGVQAWTSVLSGPEVRDDTYWNSSGEPPWAQVGYCGFSGCNNIQEAWSYFQFDTGFLGVPGRRVLSGRLETSVVHSPDCGTYREHEIYKAHAQIHPGTTWNNRPGGNFIARFGVPYANSDWGCPGAKAVWLDVTSTVNLGWTSTYLIKAVVEGDSKSWRKYNPAATVLRVHYNTRPDVPTELSTDAPLPRPCTHCGGLPFVGDASIRFKARLRDPDGDNLRARWHPRVNGVVQPVIVGGFKHNGEIHDQPYDLTSHHDKVVDWQVEPNDGTDSSERWSAGGGSFRVDRVPPGAKPAVSGLLYRQDGRWHGGVGVQDTFTFDSNGVGDVDHFLYWFTDQPATKVDADELGGRASVTRAPPGDGPRALFVQSVDRAGHRSPMATYRFYVRAGSGPLAQWSFEGNADDEAFLGDRHGTLDGDVSYGPGAVGQALQLGGSVTSLMTAPNTVRTDTSFSVAAWVKPDPASPAQVMGAVSQDGAVSSGFYLSYRGDMGKWAFLMVHNGTDTNPPGTFALSRRAPQLGKWTHLTGVYDRLENEIRLYVNGVLAEEKALPAGFVPWHAGRSLRVGRQRCSGDRCDPWAGSIDEVKVYDRVLTGAEVRAMVGQDDVQAAHWRFDEAQGASARNQVEGGEMAVLHNGAAFTGAAGGAVKGGLRLDGTDDYASTTGPVVRSDQSFSVAAWVKLEQRPPVGSPDTAVSQDGTTFSGFRLGYRQLETGGVWEFYAPSADAVDEHGDEMVRSSVPAELHVWTHLAAVYDGGAGEIRLYVNGQPAGTAPRRYGFDAAGPLVVGRGWWDGGPANHWPGLVDEVRLYSRELSAAEIQGIVGREDVAVAEWKLDGNTEDTSGNGHHATLSGRPDAEWAGGQAAAPDQTDLAVRLDGAAGHVSAPHVVHTNRSFAVSAWAKLDASGGLRTVLSQDGSRVSAFKLRATPDGRWSFVMFPSDVDGGGGRAEVFGGAAQVGSWTYLVAMYDAAAHRISLYVNGVHAGSAEHTHAWDHEAGGLQIGRAKFDGNDRIEYFPGVIDDVAVYGRVLFAEEIRAMAGRDLSLAHNWALDEGSGSSAADAVGRRTATLSGGARHVPGRLGNAVALDGVDDVVSTDGVDVRTDESFTVTAWAHLASTCDPGERFSCKLVAVSVDGANTSKFRLGHLVDQDQNDPGVWVFEMAESDAADAPVTKAAVSTLPSDLGAWVHLAGVYDKPTRKLWLYVNGTRIGDGTLNNAWEASGGLRIGRGRDGDGAPAQFFPGEVDDVRLYSGPLDDDRISNLYNAYLEKDGPVTLPGADAGHWKLDEGAGTTTADTSGRGLTATLRGGASWWGGRAGGALLLDGASGHAVTAGSVVNTGRSFSVAAWVFLSRGEQRTQAVLAQEGVRSSAFVLEYRDELSRWAAIVPGSDEDDPTGNVVLASTEPVPRDQWAHLTMVYDANLQQLRLYVNGVLSAAQTGVVTWGSTGPLAIGRARWNGQDVDWLGGAVDDVRAFSRALSDGEVREVHDDVPPAMIDLWRFDDGTARAWTPRGNHATTTGTVSYLQGISGLALALDGVTGSATARFLGPSARDSFTVSAWAKLASKDQAATVLAQDAVRASAFFIQYRPNLDRWVFGAPVQDADAMPAVYAHSSQPAEAGRWTHLVGVYDHPAREFRLYVDGELAGRKTGVALWVGEGAFTIGRAKRDGAPADLFPGAVDEVRVEIGVVADDEIARRAVPPASPVRHS